MSEIIPSIRSITQKGDKISTALILLRRLRKEYYIKDNHVEGLYTILFDIAKFGYEGEE